MKGLQNSEGICKMSQLISKFVSAICCFIGTTVVCATSVVIDQIEPFVVNYEVMVRDQQTFNTMVASYEAGLDLELTDAYYQGMSNEKRADLHGGMEHFYELVKEQVSLYTNKTKVITDIINNLDQKFQKLLNQQFSVDVYVWAVPVPYHIESFFYEDKPSIAINMPHVIDYSTQKLQIILSKKYFGALQQYFSKDWPNLTINALKKKIFEEGWSSFAASVVNNITSDNLALDVDNSDLERFDQIESDILVYICAHIDGTDRISINKLFSDDREISAPFPIRTGELLGFKLAKKLTASESEAKVLMMNYQEFDDSLDANFLNLACFGR